MLKYAKSVANWFTPFNDVANQTVTPLFGPPCIAGCTEEPYYGRPGHSVGIYLSHC